MSCYQIFVEKGTPSHTARIYVTEHRQRIVQVFSRRCPVTNEGEERDWCLHAVREARRAYGKDAKIYTEWSASCEPLNMKRLMDHSFGGDASEVRFTVATVQDNPFLLRIHNAMGR